jgi:hypothetical protein
MAPKLLDSLKKSQDTKKLDLEFPAWVVNGPPVTKKLFCAVEEIFTELQNKIIAGDISNIDTKNGPIVNAHIAERACVSATNIRIDRQVDLFTHIEVKNVKLTKLLKSKKSKKSTGRRKIKKELVDENKKLNVKIKKLEQEKHHDFFTKIIDSQLMMKQKDLALQNQKLLLEVTNHEETIRNLRRQVNQYMKQLNNL